MRVSVKLEPRKHEPVVMWSWERESAAPEDKAPKWARLRGTLRALVAGAVGGVVFVFWSRTVGSVALGIATFVLLSALVSPNGLYDGIERLFVALGQATGRALAWLLLVPVFVVFFVPFGVLLRRGRRDRMQRFFDPDADSYWEPRQARASSRRRLY